MTRETLTETNAVVARSSISVVDEALDRALERADFPQPVADVARNRAISELPVDPVPHVDYARSLTAEGGIKIVYLDIDRRISVLLGRVLLFCFALCVATALVCICEAAFGPFVSVLAATALTVAAWFVVFEPTKVHCCIEVRPDCMILDELEVFWRKNAESWPAFQARNRDFVLSGVYGTRQVDYLMIRRRDKFDRAPEVLAQHVTDAIHRLWERPSN